MASGICSATLERRGAPHLCLLTEGHQGQHVCNSCAEVWHG